MRNEFTIGADSSPEKVLGTVQQHGLAMLPDFVTGDDLRVLQEEFKVFYSGSSAKIVGEDKVNCHNLRIDKDSMSEQEFPVSRSVFLSEWMRETATLFYGETAFDFNSMIFVCHHFESDRPVNQLPYLLHFDKLQMLKFFLYIEDTGPENGALEVVPGSHLANRERRVEARMQGSAWSEVKNVVEDEHPESTPLTGSAGSLVVFDTDLAHKAGHVQPGSDRKVIRGHSRRVGEIELGKQEPAKRSWWRKLLRAG